MNKAFSGLFAALIISAIALPATAQPADGVHRIGFLSWGGAKSFKLRMDAFRDGMRDLGYVEGNNLVIEERYGEGRRERLPALAMQLVSLKPDVIITHGEGAAKAADRAAKRSGRVIPVVFAVASDPVGEGIVASLARPGGNITGLSDSHSDLVAKRLALLKEVVPSVSRIAVISDPDGALGASQLTVLRAAAPAIGVTILPVKVAKPADLERASTAIRREHADALNVLGYSLSAKLRPKIAAFALENHLPTIGASVRNAEAGYLMSYGANLRNMYRRAASYVDRILKGAKPADLPVEQPTRFYLTINLKTAKALGITIPRATLLRADRVIE